MSTVAESLPRRPAWSAALPAVFIAALFALSLAPRIAAIPALARSFWGACGLLAAWYLVVLVRARGDFGALGVERQVIRVHWVQMCVHSSIFAYWGWYWPWIYGQVPLILGQVLFAYSFTTLLSWTRGERYRLGFGPVPIMLSTNLFLTFKDEWFYLQFAMIAFGFLGKELIRWQKDGRSAHIFNPSALALFVFSMALIVSGQTGLSWGNEIAVDLEIPPHIFYLLFALGLVVQSLFRVTLVTLGSALALYLLGVLYTAATGLYWFIDSGIPVAVFLGLHLLVTDPATSPRSDLGRFVFGLGYGVGVFALYGLLERLGVPGFYDKLLCVPFLNLAVRAIDRAVAPASGADTWLPARLAGLDPARRNLVYMGLWIVLFALMAGTGFLGERFAGRSTAFWQQACAGANREACRVLVQIRADDCNGGAAPSCASLATAELAGRLPARDTLQPIRLLARGCDLGNQPTCASLASALGTRERSGLEASCAAKDAGSCYVLGMSALLGLGSAQDRSVAFNEYRRACELSHPGGCNVVAQMYRYGVGTVKDPARARESHDRACSLALAPSCTALAAMLASGEGGPVEERRAHAMQSRACLLGERSACGR